ncbi:MAG TPA: VCBS repeat-containing protein [Parasegetibacter sp.]
MKIRNLFLLVFATFTGQILFAQSKTNLDFSNLIINQIKGAPVLSEPVMITGKNGAIFSEGLGWAAPAFFDWDGDGKKDLLLGEFGSGAERNQYLGNFIRLFKNTGSEDNPVFDDFRYAPLAHDENIAFSGIIEDSSFPKHLVNYGTPLSIPQFCCMSIIPQFADLNNDGRPDLYAGRYSPGEVYWFRGSNVGFLPGDKLNQFGNASTKKVHTDNRSDPGNWGYWAYSAVSFGEFTGDSLLDMIVGGGQLRISKNIGTAESPAFGKRVPLLDIDGDPIWDNSKRSTALPYVVDWDQDGILDLLVASSYTEKHEIAVQFFKGVKVKGEHRFEKGVSLFESKTGGKAFPGEYLMVFVTDWNNDGINDLLVGSKLALVDGEFDEHLNWTFSSEQNSFVGKINPGYYPDEYKSKLKAQITAAENLEKEIGVEEMENRYKVSKIREDREMYMPSQKRILEFFGGDLRYETLIHRGYVFLLSGKKINE